MATTLKKQVSAVVLLSGGLDSTTTLAIANYLGFEIHALTFRYGQRHDIEVAAAGRVAERMKVAYHQVIDLDATAFSTSALVNRHLRIPKDRSRKDIGNGIPNTYVPARNTIFLGYALATAETIGAQDIFIGVNALDYSGYPDCRPEYIEAFQKMANLATRAGVEGKRKLAIHAPLIRMTKAEIIAKGLEFEVDYSDTISCYEPSSNAEACGQCDACLLRLEGFESNHISDPARYWTPKNEI